MVFLTINAQAQLMYLFPKLSCHYSLSMLVCCMFCACSQNHSCMVLGHSHSKLSPIPSTLMVVRRMLFLRLWLMPFTRVIYIPKNSTMLLPFHIKVMCIGLKPVMLLLSARHELVSLFTALATTVVLEAVLFFTYVLPVLLLKILLVQVVPSPKIN